jgi:hypothetical protein
MSEQSPQKHDGEPIYFRQSDPYHYFFLGTVTENILADYIAKGEGFGAEFVQLIPSFIQARSSIAQANGQPQMIPVLRVFMRCRKSAWPGIESRMATMVEDERKKSLL